MIRDHRPFDHMAEWSDAAQRADCARCVGRVLLAGLVPTTFASSFVADILTSMPKLFIDLLQAVVQRQEYAAGSNTRPPRRRALSQTLPNTEGS